MSHCLVSRLGFPFENSKIQQTQEYLSLRVIYENTTTKMSQCLRQSTYIDVGAKDFQERERNIKIVFFFM